VDRQPFLIGIIGFGIISGIFSPLKALMHVWLLNFAGPLFLTSPAIFAFIVSLFTSTIIIILAGVPAAVYERVTGQEDTTAFSLWIWLAAAAILSLPAVFVVISVAF